jgi:hypothetical protein
MESKIIFKEKDVVYVTSLGWGVVIDAGCSTIEGWVGIETNSGRIIHVDTYLVSFTEYTLEGFSQEREPKKGQPVWVRDSSADSWLISQFISYSPLSSYPYAVSDDMRIESRMNFKFMTTENPYINPTKQ